MYYNNTKIIYIYNKQRAITYTVSLINNFSNLSNISSRAAKNEFKHMRFRNLFRDTFENQRTVANATIYRCSTLKRLKNVKTKR